MNFGTGMDRTYNFISIGFLIAGALVCIGTFVFVLIGGGNDNGGFTSLSELPTEFIPPTFTPSTTPTFTRTPLPTTIPDTATPTETPTRTVTFTPTATTSPTLSPTPTITTTTLPTATPTETDTPAPTLGTPPPSPSPYLFALSNEVVYTSNLNSSGCTWQGIGGQVLDLNGNAYPAQLTIKITGGGLAQPLTAVSGDNTLYGPGGYEVQLANGINTQIYTVQLVSVSGNGTIETPVAEPVQVTFPGTCEGNLALVTFQQTRPN